MRNRPPRTAALHAKRWFELEPAEQLDPLRLMLAPAATTRGVLPLLALPLGLLARLWTGPPQLPAVLALLGGEEERGADCEEETFKEWEYEIERITDCGDDDVLVAFREHGTGALSEAPVEAANYAVITVRDGKVRRYREFHDEATALEAAGLRE